METGASDTLELLARLQAGLLDDAGAARARRRIRTDPIAARHWHALERVRHELAALGSDSATAAQVPPDVTDRITAALRAASGRDDSRT